MLDTTNPNKSKVLDYFGIQGELISSDQIGNVTFGHSRNVKINSRNRSSDIDGNNGSDFVNGSAVGTYERNFKRNTNLTIVQINTSDVEVTGDTLIGNLGRDFIYGTIWNDKLRGTNGADKIYASLGDDKIDGNKGDDILEGGQGNDTLDGGQGNDSLNGGSGNDILIGGEGDDVLVGGDGYDKFIFNFNDSLLTSKLGDVQDLLGGIGINLGIDNLFNVSDRLLKNEFDVIQDFKIGIDKIEFTGLHDIDANTWLNEMFDQGNITDSNDGLLLSFNSGDTQQTLLLSGVSSNQFRSESILVS